MSIETNVDFVPGPAGTTAPDIQRSIDWQEPAALPAGLPPVAAFDYGLLPDALHSWVRDIADRMQCPGQSNVLSWRQECFATIYPAGEPTGRETAQVGLSKPSGELVSGDAETYEKWTQALASAEELARAATEVDSGGEVVTTAIIPILVVPDGTLWRTTFVDNGAGHGEPARVDRCQLYVDRKYPIGRNMASQDFTIPNLEIATVAGLQMLLQLLRQKTTLFPDRFADRLDSLFEGRLV